MNRSAPFYLALMAVAIGLSTGCSSSNAAKSADGGDPRSSQADGSSLAVTTEAVRREEVSSTVTATGSVVAWQEAVVGAETSGVTLTEVSVDEGAHVVKGDLLARLDDSLLGAEIEQQNATIAEATANLASAELVEQRGEKLLSTNTLSQGTQQDRVTSRKTAQAKLDAAVAALKMLEVQFDRSRITAPVDGTISKRTAILGEVVQAGSELFRIVRDSRLEVAVKVAEQHLGSIHDNQSVSVTSAAGDLFTGKIRTISPTVDAQTRLATLYVSLPDGSSLRPGMSAHVAISLEASNVLTIPEAALVWRNGNANVFTVAADGSVALRAVTTGSRANGRLAVEGLREVDRVVTDGAGFLNEGDKVRVVAEAATAGE